MNKKFLFFLALFFLLPYATAELLVGISPKDGIEAVSALYPHESREYVVSVLNDSPRTVEGIVLRISVDKGLMVADREKEFTQIAREIAAIRPGERASVVFTVRGTEKSVDGARLLVEYGTGEEFFGSTSLLLDVVDVSLRLEARALRASIEQGDKSSIAVTAKNVGKNALENVVIELVLPAGIIPLTPPLLIPVMYPGDQLSDKGFGFEFDPAITGNRELILRASFTENGTLKILEKKITVGVQDRTILVAGIIVVIAALAALSYFSSTRKKK